MVIIAVSFLVSLSECLLSVEGDKVENGNFQRILDMEDLKYETGIIRHMVGRSSAHCGKNCLKEEGCRSFLINKNDRNCTLTSVIKLDQSGTIHETGWRYFILQSNEASTVSVDTTTESTTIATTALTTTETTITTEVLTTAAGTTCPSDYYTLPTTTVCLKYYAASGLTQTSQKQAVCVNDGGRLLRIENAVTQEKLTDYLTSFISNTALRILIQGEEDGPGGTWRFDDGTAMNYLPWKPGQPNDVTHNCIALRPMDFTWVDISCIRDTPFICQIVL